MSSVHGVDVPAVSNWLQAHVAGAVAPFAFDIIAGGHSNLTFKVTGADGRRFVLRRPPLGHVLASAHDMGREHRIISGLQRTAVPVAPALGFCDDVSVNGSPFYVMGFVDGFVLRDRATSEAVLTVDARRTASESLVDTMAAIHSVDLQAAGLHELGRHEGYIARQLKRWYGQWNQQQTRALPAVDRVHDELSRRIPEQGPATIVHGDYRLDNCMVAGTGQVVAVLDWEICTLGDPLADLGVAAGVLDRPQRPCLGLDRLCHHRPRVLRPGAAGPALRAGQRPRSQQPAVLRVVRVLEAGVHPGRCVRPVRGWRPRGTRRSRAAAVQAAGGSRRRSGRADVGAADMNSRYELHGELPSLDRPVLVVHLHGWIDASGAAAAAMAALDSACNTTTLATFDGDTFIDYRARRPTMELREGVNTRLVWNDIELKVGADSRGHPVLTLTGPEPDSQWRAFAGAVTQLALQLGVYQMVALGSYPFASPHTRPARLSSSSPSADVVGALPYLKNSVDVPAGMSAVLEHGLTEAGIASLGLWVQVPHYVSAMSYPAASAALLDGLREVTGITIDGSGLAGEAEIQRQRIDVLVGGNDEHRAMVQQLESLYDEAEQQTIDLDRAINDLPSGDELAAEFEQFLRDQSE